MIDKGYVIQLQNFSINDGDGIRTTIFMMGCPLRCNWCSNPETWATTPVQATFITKELICPSNDYSTKIIDETICPICQKKLNYQETITIKTLGEEMSVKQIVNKIKRQEIFYRFSQGGVTFSGGEPTFQSDFLTLLVNELEKLNIDMAIETSGYFDFEKIKDTLAKLSHIFYDLKCLDDNLHQKMTGVSNQIILENLIKLKELALPITIRIPAIKEVNFTKDNLSKTLTFLKTNFQNYPLDLEFLPYHKYGEEKYEALKIKKDYYNFSAPSSQEINEVRNWFEKNGISTIEYK